MFPIPIWRGEVLEAHPRGRDCRLAGVMLEGPPNVGAFPKPCQGNSYFPNTGAVSRSRIMLGVFTHPCNPLRHSAGFEAIPPIICKLDSAAAAPIVVPFVRNITCCGLIW